MHKKNISKDCDNRDNNNNNNIKKEGEGEGREEKRKLFTVLLSLHPFLLLSGSNFLQELTRKRLLAAVRIKLKKKRLEDRVVKASTF